MDIEVGPNTYDFLIAFLHFYIYIIYLMLFMSFTYRVYTIIASYPSEQFVKSLALYVFNRYH